jgi:hypothetical protein
MKLGAFVAAALMLAACVAAPPTAPAVASAEVREIVSTTSFGMCVGYCTTRLEITEGQAVLIRQARGGRGAPQNLPDQRFMQPLSAEEWGELSRLAAETDLRALPDVIGCPDCADGGAESLTLGSGRTITFDHGAAIAEAQPLLDRVRELRARLTPAE